MSPELYPFAFGVLAQLALLMWKGGYRLLAVLNGIVAVLLFVLWIVGYQQ